MTYRPEIYETIIDGVEYTFDVSYLGSYWGWNAQTIKENKYVIAQSEKSSEDAALKLVKLLEK